LLQILKVISRQFEFQIIANANYAVDSFFYMTGFLVGYFTLRQLIKHRRIPLVLYYLHRVWRLTPPLIMMVLTLWFLSPYLGNGPWWYNFKQSQLRNCNANWWATLLYINNFYPTDFMKQCGEWTWFSAVDMQFYIISPIIVYTYYRNKKLGLGLMGIMLTATLIATGIFAYKKQYTVNALDLQSSSDFSYMSEFYEKPWTRLPAYLIGMLSAFILIYIEDNPDQKTRAAVKWAEKHHEPVKRHLPWWLQTVLLTCGLTIILSCSFGTYSSFQPGQSWTFDDARTILWNTFGRPGFACGLALMMHVLYMGHGFFINKILSWDAWSPVARLTYSAYLWHPVVMQVILSNFKTLVHYDYWTVACYFLAFSLGSYIVALGSFLLIERPIMNLESLVLPQHK
jgi:peptidoglycan/LPS O-acetylase OafA/YrhL